MKYFAKKGLTGSDAAMPLVIFSAAKPFPTLRGTTLIQDGWMRTIAFGLVILCPLVVLAGKTCYSPEDALLHQNKDVCVAAHIYDVVKLADGTRFLDLCGPETPDEVCRFTVMSANGDRKKRGRPEPVPATGYSDSWSGAAVWRAGGDHAARCASVSWRVGEISPQSGSAAWVFC
jgi:hypothetical protein